MCERTDPPTSATMTSTDKVSLVQSDLQTKGRGVSRRLLNSLLRGALYVHYSMQELGKAYSTHCDRDIQG